jgi:peptidoglycan/LPS O-acetylase OafA/YrhL
VLDFDSLLAGAWFIAIDFQLFLVMLCIAWLGGKAADSRKAILVIVTLTSTLSLFWFNRNPQYDDWALYFFGAYGMGAIAYWASQRGHSTVWLWLNVLLATLALLIDFRLRILIAVLVALILFATNHVQIRQGFVLQKIIHYLGMISYSLFLVHFSVLMITNAIFSWLNITNPASGIFFMLISWIGSLILANFFYRRIEKPATSLLKFGVKSH